MLIDTYYECILRKNIENNYYQLKYGQGITNAF